MTDLLDRLRAANPVPACALPDADRLWRTLSADDAGLKHDGDAAQEGTGYPTVGSASTQRVTRRRFLPSPSRRRVRAARLGLSLAPLAAVAVILLLVAALGGPAAPSVAARAYAATTPTGVIDHYVEISRSKPAPGAPSLGYSDSRSEVWFSATRTHVLSTEYLVSAGGHRSVRRGEQAIDGRRATRLLGGNALYTSILPPPGEIPIRSCQTVLVCDFEPADPITTMHQLYRAGRLHDAGRTVYAGRSVDVLVGRERSTTGAYRGSGTDVRILVDPQTFVPVEVVTRSYGVLGAQTTVHLLVTETTTITDYRRIPLTPQTTKLLAMRPHPGAHTLCVIGRSPATATVGLPVPAAC